MFFLFRYNKDGIPRGLIRFHDLLVKDTVEYFEKGKTIRKGIKHARKVIDKAYRIAKKRERNPAEKIARVLDVFKRFREEVEYTRRALRATHDNMENALRQIEEERIDEPLALIENARELFLNNDFEKGLALLKESKEKIGKKVLLKTRTALFSGISSEVKDLIEKIEALRKKKLFT